jgi:DNA repair protein RecO (recombination protein O)
MDWTDEGIVIAVRRHGESAAILEAFTEGHGRHAGVVRGGGGRRLAPLLQPGNLLSLVWTARLEEHVGSFRVDPVATVAGAIMADRTALAALASLASLIGAALPERAPHPDLYGATRDLVLALARAPDWPERYARWELALLDELGFGLDLGRCALTGSVEDLAYVSPRTGRAVAQEAGAPWAARLLPLPAFLSGGERSAEAHGVGAALALTGHFLEARLAPHLPRGVLPPARARAVALLSSRERD